jgi:hypothetical protein
MPCSSRLILFMRYENKERWALVITKRALDVLKAEPKPLQSVF